MPLLFLGKRAAQINQFLEQLVDVPATRVVRVDKLLESGEIVRTRPVQPHHAFDLRADRRLELLEFGVATLGRREARSERLEVDSGKVNNTGPFPVFPDSEPVGRD